VIALDIPGFRALRLAHLVCDFNGTLACDGRLVRGVPTRLVALSRSLDVHVITADTFGTARSELARVGCDIRVIGSTRQSAAKRAIVQALGAERVVAIGNGRNDRRMFESAALAIAVCGPEGLAREALVAADAFIPSIVDALDALRLSKRLVATLRD
jgi:soluble P-type ATPase